VLFPGSCFVTLVLVLVPDPAAKEKSGFIVGPLAGANDDGLAGPSWVCVPAEVFPNSDVDSPVATPVGCPRFVDMVPSPALMLDDADTTPLVGTPVDLPSLVPNSDG
jgi:hypothetical protein